MYKCHHNVLCFSYYVLAIIDSESGLGVDRLSAPILSILPIIDIGHFKTDLPIIIIIYIYIYIIFFYYANKHTIYR